MQFKKIILAIVGVVFISGVAIAAQPSQDPPPLAMLRTAAAKMIKQLDKNRGRLKSDDKVVYNIVDSILVPHVSLDIMARSVVGRNDWQNASPALHQQFITEFKRYVIRTYSGAISEYDGEIIKFYPMRSFNPAQDTRVQIYSDLLQKDGPAIPISYRLIKQGSEWVIYDFSVEGVSLVQNYRSQFAGPLREGGLQKLVADLQKHNKGIKNN